MAQSVRNGVAGTLRRRCGKLPAEEAMAELVRCAEQGQPAVRDPHRMVELWMIEEVLDAGFTLRQVADAIMVPMKSLQRWHERRHDRVRAESPDSVTKLRWLVLIAWRRHCLGYSASSTALWWGNRVAELAWDRPYELFAAEPELVLGTIPVIGNVRLFQSEPPGSRRPGWMDIPGILQAA